MSLSVLEPCNFALSHLSGKDDIDNGLADRNNSIDQSPGPSSSQTNGTISFDMCNEENRFKTFDRWPLSFLEPRILAKTGFYFIGPFDQVKCQFCKVQIKNWESDDNEVTEHKRWSPNCPLLKRRKTNNIPLEPLSELDQLLPPPSYDICGTFEALDIRPGSFPESSFSRTPNIENEETTTMKQAKHPKYAIEADRYRSYEEWPLAKKQTSAILSDAGFYYCGCGDRVICFSCGGSLKDWDDEDEPWEQHALWFSKCDYVRLVKGKEYIESIKKKFDLITDDSSQEINNSTNLSSSLSSKQTNEIYKPCESRLCKICYSNEYNTVFVPCGHVIACGKCASSMTTCPLCRKTFDNILRIFFS